MIDMEKFEFAGARNTNSYSTYFKDNFSTGGTPKGYDLEKYLNNPQDNIDNICSLSRYFYYKSGVIMRTVNLIRDFGITEVKKDYGKSRAKVKKIIEDYDKRINLNKLMKDILFELALTGNVATYDRDGKYVDIFPLSVIEVSELIIDGKTQLKFDHSKFRNTYSDISEKEQNLLKNAYPDEVKKASQADTYTDLNIENTYFIKTNCSRYEKYGVTFLLPAFSELAQKSLLKEAEKSTASGIVDQILHVKVGDKENKPGKAEIEFYNELFTGKKGSLRVVTPYTVSLEWISPETDVFGEEKFLEIDKDILSALGVSLTLLRGDGGGNYSDGVINIAGLVRTIESMREEIPNLIEELYKKELKRHGIKEENCPKVSLSPIEIDNSTKAELVQWLFQSAGLPYEVLFDELGYDFESVKAIREEENKNSTEDVFKLRQQPFQGQQGMESTNEVDKGGRPEKNESERDSDVNQSNNEQPRAGQKKLKA